MKFTFTLLKLHLRFASWIFQNVSNAVYFALETVCCLPPWTVLAPRDFLVAKSSGSILALTRLSQWCTEAPDHAFLLGLSASSFFCSSCFLPVWLYWPFLSVLISGSPGHTLLALLTNSAKGRHQQECPPSHLGCSSLNPVTDSSTRTPSSPSSGSHCSLDLHADACMAQYLLMSLRLNCSRKVKEKEENANYCDNWISSSLSP